MLDTRVGLITDINFEIRCYDNQLSLGRIVKTDTLPPLLFALAFHNQLEYHHLNARINNDNDLATPDINLVGFCPVILEYMCLIH